jgi:hypothetical protein
MTIKKHLFALMLLLNGCVEELKMVKGGVIGDRLAVTFKGKIPTERIPEAWELGVKKASSDLSCLQVNAVRDTVYRWPTDKKDDEGEIIYNTDIGGSFSCRQMNSGTLALR